MRRRLRLFFLVVKVIIRLHGCHLPSVMLPGSSLILTRIAPVRNYIGKFFRETPLLTYMLWCRSLCPQEGGTFYSHRQKKGLTNPPLLGIITLSFADLAHLVERHLAKVEVASSSLVIRSNKKHKAFRLVLFCS